MKSAITISRWGWVSEGGKGRQSYVGSLLLSTSKSTLVQCCRSAKTGCRKVNGIRGNRGVGRRVMKQELLDIVFGEARQEAANVSEEIVFGLDVERYEVICSFVGIILSFVSQATIIASQGSLIQQRASGYR